MPDAFIDIFLPSTILFLINKNSHTEYEYDPQKQYSK
jgi:hypothetical protein